MQTVFKGVSICQLSFPMIKTYQKTSKNAYQGGCCISNEMQLQWSWKKKVALRLGFRAELLVEVVLVTSEIDGCGQNEELCYSVHQWMHLTLKLVSINEVLEKQDPGGGRRRYGCGCLVLMRSDDASLHIPIGGGVGRPTNLYTYMYEPYFHGARSLLSPSLSEYRAYNCRYDAGIDAILHAWLTCKRHFHMCSSSCLQNAVEWANGVYKTCLCSPCRLFLRQSAYVSCLFQ